MSLSLHPGQVWQLLPVSFDSKRGTELICEIDKTLSDDEPHVYVIVRGIWIPLIRTIQKKESVFVIKKSLFEQSVDGLVVDECEVPSEAWEEIQWLREAVILKQVGIYDGPLHDLLNLYHRLNELYPIDHPGGRPDLD